MVVGGFDSRLTSKSIFMEVSNVVLNLVRQEPSYVIRGNKQLGEVIKDLEERLAKEVDLHKEGLAKADELERFLSANAV